jgi:hypothetical protein
MQCFDSMVMVGLTCKERAVILQINKASATQEKQLFVMSSRTSLICAVLAVCLTPIQSKASGRIVAAFDDWTMANVGFVSPCEPGTFATNVAAWFT